MIILKLIFIALLQQSHELSIGSLVESPRCEIATPVMIITIRVGKEIAR